MKIYKYTPLILLLLSIIFSFVLYFFLPDTVPLHWSSNGTVDRTGTKLEVSLLFPIIIFVIYFVNLFNNPLKEEKSSFSSYYLVLLLQIVISLFYIIRY